MVSIYKQKTYGATDSDGIKWEVFCKSTDTKPVSAPNGSSLVEMDTGKVYFFDADSNQWSEF
jgi:hypothetical protein